MLKSATKVTVNLSTDHLNKIKAIAELKEESVTDTIWTALNLYIFLEKAKSDGKKVLLEKDDEFNVVNWK